MYPEITTGFRTDFFVLSIAVHRWTYAVVCRYAKYVRSNVESLDRNEWEEGHSWVTTERERQRARRKGTKERSETVRKSGGRSEKKYTLSRDSVFKVLYG